MVVTSTGWNSPNPSRVYMRYPNTENVFYCLNLTIAVTLLKQIKLV